MLTLRHTWSKNIELANWLEVWWTAGTPPLLCTGSDRFPPPLFAPAASAASRTAPARPPVAITNNNDFESAVKK